jgi:signal transduction histidine kinase
MLEGMTGPEQPGALARWQAWWLSEPAPGTADSMTARWAAILRRARHSRVMAVVEPVLPTLFVAAVAAAQLAHRSGSARSPLAVASVFSVLLAVPLIWRRRYPAATFGFLAAIALTQWVTGTRLMADVALLIALYAMFEHSPARINWLAALALGLGAMLAVLRWERAGYRLQTLLLLTGTAAAALSAGIAVRNRRMALTAATERGERRERERHQQALLESAAERARIAREMHDIVAHSLSVMVRLSDAAAAKLPLDPGRSSSAMVQVSVTGREALQDMRRLLGVLRTESDGTALRPPPGLADLGALFQQVRATGLDVEPEVTGVPGRIGPGVELVVYRTVQEALTNVLKHARHPTRVRVGLTYGPEQTVIEVEDDGAGLPAGSDQHAGDRHGLTGMAERIAVYGGQLRACPAPGRGWRLRATVPTPENPAPGDRR